MHMKVSSNITLVLTDEQYNTQSHVGDKKGAWFITTKVC